MFCNVMAPQVLWSSKLRKNILVLWIVAMFANAGMWFERFVIIVTSLTRDFLPSSWHAFHPTWVDLCTLAGSFGLFFTLFLLFCRFLPVVAMAEVKTVMPQAHAHVRGRPDIHRADYGPDEHHSPDYEAPRVQ